MKAKALAYLASGLVSLALLLFSNTVCAQDGIRKLNHRVIDAEYSKYLDAIITVSSTPKNQLHIYDIITQRDTGVSLPHAPTCVSVSPDGQYAVVGHNLYISYVRLTKPATVLKTIPVSCIVYDVVLAGNGYAYAFPSGNQLESIRYINLETGVEALGAGDIYGGTRAKLHAGGKSIYGINCTLSPPNIQRYDITNLAPVSVHSYPPYYEFQLGGDLQLSEDGSRIFSVEGVVFRSSDVQEQDMTYNGTMSDTGQFLQINHSAAAKRVVAILHTNNSSDMPIGVALPEPNPDVEVWLYDDSYLNIIKKKNLPDFSFKGIPYRSHGRFIFFNRAGTNFFVIVQADALSEASLDYGIVTFETTRDFPYHTIGTSASQGGKITPSGPIDVQEGCAQTVSISPGQGYDISDVKVDGVSIGKQTSYQFDNIVKDHTISATFTPCPQCPQNPLKMLNHKVRDAEYSKTLERIITVSPTPKNQLHIYNPATEEDVAVDLPLSPTCVSVGPDGQHAAVGHDGWISYVDLTVPALLKTIPASCPVRDIVLAGNGYAYLLSNEFHNDRIRCIQLETAQVTLDQATQYILSRAKLHMGGNSMYVADRFSPSGIQKHDITNGTGVFLYESPSHRDFDVCADLWLSDDGSRIFTKCGNIFQASELQSEDMTHDGILPEITSIVHLTHSLSSNKIITIPGNSDQETWIYDYNSLDYSYRISFPTFQNKGIAYAAHGKFAFSHTQLDRYFFIVQADTASNLPIDYGIVTISPKPTDQIFTIIASAGPGGQINPNGQAIVSYMQDFAYSITPNKGYKVTAIIIDGVAIATPSTSYTFHAVTADHTIRALFAPDYDYFGTQVGDTQAFRFTQNSAVTTGTYTVSLDSTTTPASYRVHETLGSSASDSWYLNLTSTLQLSKMMNSQMTVFISSPLTVLKNPMAAGMTWTSQSTVTVAGSSGTMTIKASISALTLVTVPAGTFLAYPVAYTETVTGAGGTASDTWTEYFVPYIGTVKAVRSDGVMELTGFTTALGVVSTPPPVIASVSPTSATPGSAVTISGYQFGTSQGTSVLKIGGTTVTNITSWSNGSIRCVVPLTAPTGKVTLATDLWNSNDNVVLTVIR